MINKQNKESHDASQDHKIMDLYVKIESMKSTSDKFLEIIVANFVDLTKTVSDLEIRINNLKTCGDNTHQQLELE